MRKIFQNPTFTAFVFVFSLFFYRTDAAEITGPSFVCPGSVLSYSVSNPGGNTSFVWSFPPDVAVVELNANVVTVIWGISNGNICVTISQAGLPPDFTCLSVQLPPNPLPTTIDTTICEGDMIPFGNGFVGQAGTYTAQFADQYGCDSTVLLFLDVIPAPFEEVEYKDATCDKDNGKIELSIASGFNPTLIHWSTGLINETSIHNLMPGIYSVTATDGVCADDISLEILDDPFCGVRISGFVYRDDAAQSCDESQVVGGYQDVLIELRKGQKRSYQYTDENGYFSFSVDTGTYQLRPVLNPEMEYTCPDNLIKTLTFNESGAYSDKNHFFVSEKVYHDFSVSAIVPRAKPGTNQHYLLQFCNNSNEKGSGRFTFAYDDLQTWVQSDLTPSINDHIEKKAIWDIFNMLPGECHQFAVEMKLSDMAPLNKAIKGNLSVKPIAGSEDAFAENNIFNWSSPTVASVGLVFEKRLFIGNNPYSGVIYDKDTTLLYQIHFQNTNIDTVKKIVIRDTLDPMHDFSTFKIKMASHPYKMSIEADSVVVFTFNDIAIPPVTQNMVDNVLSITYGIKLKEEAAYGKTFFNDAEIKVDYDPPIMSNKVSTLLSENNLSYSGFILTEGVKPVKGVKATIAGTGTAPLIAYSNTGGFFSNQDLVPSTTYQLSLSKDEHYLNGVTTFDLLQIQKHILAIEYFNTPYKKLAADINNSNTITTADIIELRKLILGLIAELPEKESWEFVPADFLWPDAPATDVPELPKFYSFSLPGASLQEFFVGVKIGDVSGDADPQGMMPDKFSQQRADATKANWSVEDVYFEKGEELVIPLIIDDMEDLQAIQYSLSYNPAVLRFSHSSIPPSQYVPAMYETMEQEINGENVLCTSWFRADDFSVPIKGPILYFHFTSLQSAKLSDVIHLANNPVPSLSYDANGEESLLNLEWNGTPLQAGEMFPNPMVSQSTLHFVAGKSGTVIFEIYNSNGELIKQETRSVSEGEKEIFVVKAGQLPAGGVYFWRLKTGEHAESGKLLFLN